MIGEAQRRRCIFDLLDVVALPKYTITPCGNTGLFPALYETNLSSSVWRIHLRSIVLVGAVVVFVRGHKSNLRLGIVWEGMASYHLQVQLFPRSSALVTCHQPCNAAGKYLIVLVERTKVACLNQAADLVIAKTDSIVEVTEPNDSIMVIDGSIPLEPKTVTDGTIVAVSLLIVRKAGGKMSGHKALCEPRQHSRHGGGAANHTMRVLP